MNDPTENCDGCDERRRGNCDTKNTDGCEVCGCLNIFVSDYGHHKCETCWEMVDGSVKLRINRQAWDDRFNSGDPYCDYNERP